MVNPLVSVVIPCYNHEQFVKDSIQSVIDQTYENIELIIIDDGSTDDSVLEIQSMIEICQKRFINFDFRSRSNKGLCATLNESLEWCKGKYFSALASDDQMIFNKTEIQIAYLENHADISALMGSVDWVDSNNTVISKRSSLYKEYTFEDVFLCKHDLYACTQISRMKDIKSVGGYKEDCPIEDWYMWLKLSQLGKLVNLNEKFVRYRLHDDNTIKKGEIIYNGMTEIAEEYKFHPLYLSSIKRIIWRRVAAVIIKDKRKGFILLKEMVKADKMGVFHKDFYRCIRNIAFK